MPKYHHEKYQLHLQYLCFFYKITNPKVAFTQQFAMPFLFVRKREIENFSK
jgi:hypothetical protein